MRLSARVNRFVGSFLVLISLFSQSAAVAGIPQASGEYNPGPDPSTEMGRAIIDLYANLPEYMALSDAIMDEQKFRYIFGMMMTRTYYGKNSTKILFIGQDATHIAEAAKQPGTSGFGGRVQSIGRFFGVDQGVSTTNAYLSTIKGQYGAFGAVYVQAGDDGKPLVRQTKIVDNQLWGITHNIDSEIRISREKFWEWMIVNNPDSMGMMVFFGDAAKDSFAKFLMARGFDVPVLPPVKSTNPKAPVHLQMEDLKRIQVPEMKLVNAGGNAEFPVPVDKDGNDIYELLLKEKYGLKAPYFKKNRFGKVALDYSNQDVQKAAVSALQDSGQRGVDLMVFSGGGIYGSGITDLGQIAEYDFDNITFKGEKVRSMKGMKLKYYKDPADSGKAYVVERDIAFAESPHPTVLSQMSPEEAAATLKAKFSALDDLKKKGWYIEPDLDPSGKPYENRWHNGKDYKYGKEDIRAGYMEQGAPPNRRTSSADASRLDPQTIIVNTRDRPDFDKDRLTAAKKSLPSTTENPNDLWSVHARVGNSRYVFDRGPGRDISDLMAANLDLNTLFQPKPGMQVFDDKGHDVTFETKGIDAYYIKSHQNSGYFGTHRGDFKNAKALILADPHGVDDWLTSRAMTGARGQYLNGMMQDLNYGEEYLVLKTVPFGMDGASAEDWEFVRKNTEAYREVLIAKALEANKTEVIFVDGAVAQAEMDRILKKMNVTNIPVVNVKRTSLKDPAEGILEAGKAAKQVLAGRKTIGTISGKAMDIPRSHLTYWSRLWEGTGGVDLAIDSVGKERGLGYAIICPDWVVNQKVNLLETTKNSINKLVQFLKKMGVRVGKQLFGNFFSGNSKTKTGSWSAIEEQRKKFFNGDPDAPKFLGPEDCMDTLKPVAS